MRLGRIILLGLLAGAVPCKAQEAQTVVVRVRDAETGAAVVAASVRILDADTAVLASVSTDSSGSAVAPLPRSGGFFVRAERIGYASYSSRWIEAGGESLELEIRLGTDAVPLEPLIVVTRARRSDRLAGYRQRLGRGPTGNFVTREDIERRSTAPVTELIRPLAGVDVLDVPRQPGAPQLVRLIVMRGIRSDEVPAAGGANWCLPAIFLDGIRVEQSPEFPVDDYIATASLEGIEVYSSAASVPVEFQQGGSNTCGAVILWTRAAEPGQGRSGWWRWALGITGFAGIIFLMR